MFKRKSFTSLKDQFLIFFTQNPISGKSAQKKENAFLKYAQNSFSNPRMYDA